MRTAVALLVLAGFFALIERRRTVPIWRRERRVDLLWWFFTPLVSRTLTFVATAAAVILFGLHVRPWFAEQPRALQFLEALLAADFIGYASHRLFHRQPLWRFHAIHHSPASVDWLTAARVHPVNEIVSRLLQVVPLYLAGIDLRVLGGVVPFFTFYAIFLHANVSWDFGPLRYAIASPRFHRWHHTSEAEGLDRNFAGLFPWIDLMFGTFHMPRGREPERFGAGEAIPAAFLGQLAWPFRQPKNF
jgi:sterol desaturase/sphingolipid hydroxylase (fatty acid hydroxylase superfamily)